MSGELISVTTRGDFSKTETRLQKMASAERYKFLDAYGRAGVLALAAATPVESGDSAASWTYKVHMERGRYSVSFHNTHMAGGVPVVILLQYGHGTGTGGYVIGRDFINPVILPLFDRMKADNWKAVTSA